MSRRHFGTDGVRGVANSKLTPEFAQALGMAVGIWIRESGTTRRVLVGRDTRRSGPMLGAALASGLCAAGIDVVTVGVAPTPAIAYVARTGDFAFGAVVSASHNPAPDNGIKFLTHAGVKSSDELEETWETLLDDITTRIGDVRGVGREVGSLDACPELVGLYEQFLLDSFALDLSGMRIVVDAAHGAAYKLGPDVLRRLGAEVIATGVDPDGLNINAEGGATRPNRLMALAKTEGAAFGVAFDGDADRAVFTDEVGRLINGDRTIGIWASHEQALGRLEPPVVVGTVMSNGGFETYLRSLGITLERTPVGDKYVAAKMAETGALVGGEQSGHLIFPEVQPTGDGLVTTLELLKSLTESGRSAASFFDDYQPWPQLMVNVGVTSMSGWQERLEDALAHAERHIGGHGRVVVRPSGTQPMIRVMVEADELQLRDEVTAAIVAAVETKLGGVVHGRVDLTYALGD